jgi:hypothetical protein
VSSSELPVTESRDYDENGMQTDQGFIDIYSNKIRIKENKHETEITNSLNIRTLWNRFLDWGYHALTVGVGRLRP